MQIEIFIKRYPMREPFATSRDVISEIPVIEVHLQDRAGWIGRGEAAGVDYAGETVESMRDQLLKIKFKVNDVLSPDQLQGLLPAGGARNALDCALWDLIAKQHAPQRIWDLLKRPVDRNIQSCFTIGLDNETRMRQKARAALQYQCLKVKVDSKNPLQQIEWVMSEHPSAELIMDANASLTPEGLIKCMRALEGSRVTLIEQPLAVDEDDILAEIDHLIPIAADESCVDVHSLSSLQGRYDAINIKLDKCGGLTEGLRLLDHAKSLGYRIMVGNMCGSSLAMAPTWLIAQEAEWVDLDGPLLQRVDIEHGIHYQAGTMSAPSAALWG